MRPSRTGLALRCILTLLTFGAGALLIFTAVGGERDLSASDMAACRGASVMVCTYTQSCDAYNRCSGKCAGQPDGTACITCGNATTIVTYLDHIRPGECTAPQPPGLKYNVGNPPADINCGNTSQNAKCRGGDCQGNLFGLPACLQPDAVISQ